MVYMVHVPCPRLPYIIYITYIPYGINNKQMFKYKMYRLESGSGYDNNVCIFKNLAWTFIGAQQIIFKLDWIASITE